MTVFGLVTCLVLAQSSEKFFPIDEKRGISRFEEDWYGKALRAMEEQPLHTTASTTKATVYRLTILPTWGNPVAVRLSVLEGRRASKEDGSTDRAATSRASWLRRESHR